MTTPGFVADQLCEMNNNNKYIVLVFVCLVVQWYNGGLLPDIMLLTQCYNHRGTRLNAMKRFLSLQPMIPPKRFDIFPPDWGLLRRSGSVQIFNIKQQFTLFSIFMSPCALLLRRGVHNCSAAVAPTSVGI